MKAAVCALILTMFAVPVSAQTSSAAPQSAQTSRIAAGIEAGMNLSTVAGPKVTAAKQVVGLTGGIFVSAGFTKMAGLQVEAIFSQRGVKAVDGRDQAKLQLSYLDVPVLLRLGSSGDTGSTGLHAFVGPTASLKLSSSATYNGVVDPSFKDSEISGFDLGLTVGAGGSFGKIGFNARYTLGLRTLDTGTAPDDIKNRALSLMVSYRFK